jgi:hypothetical protein
MLDSKRLNEYKIKYIKRFYSSLVKYADPHECDDAIPSPQDSEEFDARLSE